MSTFGEPFSGRLRQAKGDRLEVKVADYINDNIDNLRPNRTAKQIVRQKGDKNSLERHRIS